MIVTFVRPRLPVAVLEEHLNAAPQQVLPARTHGRAQRVLVDLDEFTWREERTEADGGRNEWRVARRNSIEGKAVAPQLLRKLSGASEGASPESSCRVLKLSVLSMAVTRRATQIIHD